MWTFAPRRTPTRAAVAAVTAMTLTVTAVSAASGSSPADPERGIRQTVVFESGTDGYHTFRIPAITRAEDGTLLAFAEGRVGGGGDTGDIDLVLRRSHDGGETWGPLQVVGDNGPNVFGNPAPVVDPATGDVVLLTTHNAGTATEAEIMRGEVTAEESRRVFVQRSADHGETWSEPEDITDDTKLPEWRWYATGPVHGIALEHGQHAGRLVIPANHSTSPEPGSDDTGQEPKYYGGHSLYSDDGGHTWQIGGIDTPLDGMVNPNETTAVELSDGTVYFNARDQRGTNSANRAATTSSDGGASFDAPYSSVPDLVTPIVQGSVIKLSRKADRTERLVFSAPGHPSARQSLTLRYSADEGGSWTSGLVLHDGPAAYSDLVEVQDRAIGVLYENGDSGTYERITYAHVPTAVLDLDDPPAPPGVITPDVSGHGHDGAVHGDVSVADGVAGNALLLDGGHVEVPFTEQLATGEGPFTAAAWFRTDVQASQAILWAYNVGSNTPQWWIRAEPGSNRLRALVDTDQGVTSLAAQGDYTDGLWHHVALTRDDAAITLYVDGEVVATTGAVTGSVSSGASVGLHVGQRPDGANPLTGAVDEVRLFGRALTAEEIAGLASEPAAPTGAELLHLPLDEIKRAKPERSG